MSEEKKNENGQINLLFSVKIAYFEGKWYVKCGVWCVKVEPISAYWSKE